jgi:hypothetical protein
MAWAFQSAFFTESPLQIETAKASMLTPNARSSNSIKPICSSKDKIKQIIANRGGVVNYSLAAYEKNKLKKRLEKGRKRW